MGNPAAAKELATNPGQVLQNYGLSKYIAANDPLVETVVMAADPDIHTLAKNSDYSLFMARLKDKGYITRLGKSKLREHFMAVFGKDQESFVRYLKGAFDSNPAATLNKGKSERVNRIVDLIQQGKGIAPLEGLTGVPTSNAAGDGETAAVVTVWIAAVVYTYAAVVSQVAVVLNVAVVATVYAKMAIEVSGNTPYPELSAGVKGTSIADERMRNIQRASLAAALHGRKDLAVEVIKEAIDSEIDAVISAAEQMGLIKLPPKTRKLILGEMKQLGKEAIGVA